jgi:hypothetical protein
MLAIAVVAFVLAADTVVIGSSLRALVYAIPLVILIVVTPARAYPFLKMCLGLYIILAVGTILGLSRGMAGLLALAPAALLGIHAVRAATGYQPPARRPRE